jgi:hypothetical protein
MDAFDDAFSRLEFAERELHAAELALNRRLYLFLVGRAASPERQLVEQVCARRAAAAAALRVVRTFLERCRLSIRSI